jgi:hypothetical protein
MKKLLFVAFALMAAMIVIGVTAAIATRSGEVESGEVEPEATEEETTA